jgi:hypothetical protein
MAWSTTLAGGAVVIDVDGLSLSIISLADLKVNKRASGRDAAVPLTY